MTDIEIRTNIMNALIECRKSKALAQEQVASAFDLRFNRCRSRNPQHVSF